MDLRDARRQQTLLEVERLIDEVGKWVAHREAKDVDSGGYVAYTDLMIGILCSGRGEYDRAAHHLQQAPDDGFPVGAQRVVLILVGDP